MGGKYKVKNMNLPSLIRKVLLTNDDAYKYITIRAKYVKDNVKTEKQRGPLVSSSCLGTKNMFGSDCSVIENMIVSTASCCLDEQIENSPNRLIIVGNRSGTKNRLKTRRFSKRG